MGIQSYRHEKSHENKPLAAALVDRLIASVDGCPWATTAGVASSQGRVRPYLTRQRRITLTLPLVDNLFARFDCSPWGVHAGTPSRTLAPPARSIYTPEQRLRRDTSRWTMVQGVLAPLQFIVFLISLWLVLGYLDTGEGLAIASASIVVKTLTLYAIMITGSLWEKDVFGRYLFAPAFFWEDAVSMVVIGLHTAYLAVLFTGALAPQQQMVIALAAYAAYVINAVQFLLKLRATRRADDLMHPHHGFVGAAE